MATPRVLLFDIETINLTADLSPVLCIAYKYLGQRHVHTASIWDDHYRMAGPFSKRDLLLCEFLQRLFHDADYLCAHYGSRFDRPFLNSRFLLHSFPPIDPGIPLLDTWRLARNNLALTSNRLKNLGQFLELPHKKSDSGGWATWLDAVSGSDAARNRLIRYCRNDVLALESLYLKLQPFDATTNRAIFRSSPLPDACPTCASPYVTRSGHRVTRTRRYPRYHCEQCGRYFRTDTKDRNPR